MIYLSRSDFKNSNQMIFMMVIVALNIVLGSTRTNRYSNETDHCTNGSQSLLLKSKTASSCQKAFDGLSLGGSRPVGGPGAGPRGGPGAFWNPAHQNINNTHLNQPEWKHSDLPSLMNGLISTEILLLHTWGFYGAFYIYQVPFYRKPRV